MKNRTEMKNRKKLWKKIMKAIAQMSDEKYFKIREYKYAWFAKDGEYGGCGHHKFNLAGTPLEKAEPLTYLALMASKEAMFAAIQDMIDNPDREFYFTDGQGALSKDEIENYLFGSHADEYNRLSKFFQIESRIPDELYGQTLRNTYHQSVKKYRYRHELRRAFKKETSEGLMTTEEKDILSSLGDRVTIFRAMSAKENELEDFGVSWTLYEDIALEVGKHCFESIWEHAGFFVKKLEVSKADLHALFNTRNMWEVSYVQQEVPEQVLEVTVLEK